MSVEVADIQERKDDTPLPLPLAEASASPSNLPAATQDAAAPALDAPSPRTGDTSAKPRSRLRRGIDRLAAIAALETVALATFGTLLCVGLIYWIRLIVGIFGAEVPPFGVEADGTLVFSLLAGLAQDLLVAFALALLVFGCARGVRKIPWRGVRIGVSVPLLLALVAGLTTVGVIAQSHYGLLFGMGTGLTYEVLIESASSGMGYSEYAAMVTAGDLAFLLAPIALFLLLWLLPKAAARVRGTVLASLAGVSLVLCFGAFADAKSPINTALTRTPLYFFASDLMRDRKPVFVPKVKVAAPKIKPKPQRQVFKGRSGAVTHEHQARSIELIHPLYARNITVSKPPKRKKKQKWNLLVIVMESTGTRYMFSRPKRGGRNRKNGAAVVGPANGKPIPMQFVKGLADRGWFLKNHYSPSNSSARSIFAIMSGLFPMPELRMWSTHKIHLPSLFTLLPKSYERFLVTPGPLSWFFPYHYLRASGLKRAWGFHELPRSIPRYTGVSKAPSRDEAMTVSFFVRKLRAAKEPFAAVYYSFVPHWPYPDYGKDYQLVRPLRSIDRYTNNLLFLDRQIENIVSVLDNNGRLERTIILLVGDHGEAFHQHPGNATHSRASYNENFQTPAILFQPALFKPRVFKQRTQHVDLLPTLLDAMGLPYNRRLFQGESLFQDKRRRRFTILYGNENTLSTISAKGAKLQLSFKKRRCWVFDLAVDPWERKKLSCRKPRFTKQRTATVQYHAYQRQVLRLYSKSWRLKRSFFGQTHPLDSTGAANHTPGHVQAPKDKVRVPMTPGRRPPQPRPTAPGKAPSIASRPSTRTPRAPVPRRPTSTSRAKPPRGTSPRPAGRRRAGQPRRRAPLATARRGLRHSTRRHQAPGRRRPRASNGGMLPDKPFDPWAPIGNRGGPRRDSRAPRKPLPGLKPPYWKACQHHGVCGKKYLCRPAYDRWRCQ